MSAQVVAKERIDNKTINEKSTLLINNIGTAVQMHKGINVEIGKHNKLITKITKKVNDNTEELVMLDSQVKKLIASSDSCYIWIIILIEVFVLLIEFIF